MIEAEGASSLLLQTMASPSISGPEAVVQPNPEEELDLGRCRSTQQV
jgi:hypothetical protein